ncbi:putative acyl-CoA synthetase YngI [Tolypocladium ophioglossoides CBS 100239]|uniref:Putative acyl-CoA synthetase YngI n=1 Tax=Tolypocladium ophioglossoides (strain CBS 100239) TaxID=1163406 RepID=A0A0L0N1E7_TOLOC|nr:putative acyl-CoA synthetase YngI [Tolypocladium ophioglossoides CBS 100239]
MSAKDFSALSIVSGPTDEPLWSTTLGALIDTQARHYGDRTAVVFSWQKVSQTYRDLLFRSKLVAKALLESGIRHGDRVGITAGNCLEYIEVFLGAARIGCPVVVLNSTYAPQELLQAVTFSRCKLVCVAQYSEHRTDLAEHLDLLSRGLKTDLQLVLFNGLFDPGSSKLKSTSYNDFVARGECSKLSDIELTKKESLVRAGDTVNLQFTSGTTGSPKAAMLSHINLINNARLVGERLRLNPNEVVCCPPPLFHCFGLVMGFLGSFTNGSSIVFPSPRFDPDLVLDAIEAERCTVLYGVPTMFVAELDANAKRRRNLTSLKTGLASGSPVPQALMNRLEQDMGIQTMLIAYGMTETSPVTFATSFGCPPEHRLDSVGTVFPHTAAKIIDLEGNIVPRGVRGEICTSGYALQQGYLDNEEKTKEAMRMDADGVLWMYTGDEGVIDKDGYCRVTGRIKDMIIRGKHNHLPMPWRQATNSIVSPGGENIVPVEIEERLLAHASIVEASVVGVPDDKYGEEVACFIRQAEKSARLSAVHVADWVRQTLGRHKAPKHVFWIGDAAVGDDFPKTGSGKHQKHVLRGIGARLLRQSKNANAGAVRARL